MKETAEESADLKQKFKAFWRKHGYYEVTMQDLAPELWQEAQDFPLEYGEAYKEERAGL